jgi:hypothetical protein
MFLLIVGFGIGLYVGYKFPQQVEQVVEMVKKMFNDLKNMMGKKETPPQA